MATLVTICKLPSFQPAPEKRPCSSRQTLSSFAQGLPISAGSRRAILYPEKQPAETKFISELLFI
jgi:hypothetical protein